jgi:membrane protease YdiL (CAAX protease family)
MPGGAVTKLDSPMLRLIKRWPVASFFVLTFAISWIGVLLVVGPSGFPLDPERFEQLGPLMYVAILAGPSLASIVLTGLLDGRAGERALLARLRGRGVDLRYYALALLPALVIAALSTALSFSSPDFVPALFTAGDKTTTLLFVVVASLLFGFFEELGWSGFAVPRLLTNHGVFATGIIVGVAWGAWHFPLFWERNSFMAALPLSLLLTRLFSWLPGFRILMVWLYDRSGSLLVPMLAHAGLVAATLIFAPTAAGTTLLLQVLVLPAAIWPMVALLAVARRRWPSAQPTARAMQSA